MQRITFRTPFYLHFQIGCLDAYALFLLFFPQTLTDVSPKSFMESFAGLKKNHWENTVMDFCCQDSYCWIEKRWSMPPHLVLWQRGLWHQGGQAGGQGVQLVAAGARFCQNHGKSVATGGGDSSGVAAWKKAANVQMTARSLPCMTFPGPLGSTFVPCSNVGFRLRVIAEGRLCNWGLLFWNFLEFIRSK